MRRGSCSLCDVLWPLLIAGTSLPAVPVQARDLAPGQTHSVQAGDPVESWVVDGATLNVGPGARTEHIGTGPNATVNVDQGSVDSAVSSGLNLVGSTADLRAATVTSSRESALVVSSVTPTANGSSASVTGSTFAGVGRGVSVSGPSTVTLIDSQASGIGSGGGGIAGSGVGLSLIGATATVQGGVYTGSNNGAVLLSGTPTTNQPLLRLDHARLVGQAGSAILVGTANAALTHATIEVANQSLLLGGNGVLLEVGQQATIGRPSSVDFSVDNSALSGDIQVISGSLADIHLRNGASLVGHLSGVNSLDLLQGSTLTGTLDGATAMSLDATSAFDMTGDSSLGALSLANGTVNLDSGDGVFHVLTASSLSGQGTFVMGTDLAGHLSDLLDIRGQASGSHVLAVRNTGAEPVDEQHAQQLVHTGSGDAQFAVPGGQVDVGTYAYRLQQRGTDWYLVQAARDEGGDEDGEGDGGSDGDNGGGQEPIPTPSTRAVVGLFDAAPGVWYGELGSLRSRLGELRHGLARSGGWVRTFASKYRIDGGPALDYSQNQQGLAFGVDTPLGQGDGTWLAGMTGGYSHSDLNMHQGTAGQVDSYYLGLYGTWLSERGWYVDALLKANHLRNQADVRMSDGSKASGHYDNLGIGASLEAGRFITLDDGWFVEPFVQASGLWVGGERYSLDNGMSARSNHADSRQARAGALVGRTLALPGGGFVQPWLKLAAVHEFVDDNRVTINDTHRFDNDLSGTRGELGAGVALQWNDALQMHAEADYSHGPSIEQPWGVSIGVRYAW